MREEILDLLKAGETTTRVGNITPNPVKLKRWEIELNEDLSETRAVKIEKLEEEGSTRKFSTPTSASTSENNGSIASQSQSSWSVITTPSVTIEETYLQQQVICVKSQTSQTSHSSAVRLSCLRKVGVRLKGDDV